MSIIVRYSTGSTYTLVANKVDIEKVQDLDGQFHIPNTSIVGMMRLGLGVQKITVSGDTLDMSACLWHDVVAISFDSGTSYQTVYFSGVPYTSDCWSGIYPYALSLLASPLREGAPVRYPASGYKFGLQSISGISQAGNIPACPTIHFLAPLFYAPLSNTLIDFAGQAVTFTRTAVKYHSSMLYPINTPIFDSGLYLASDTAQDVATWTPPASPVRTIAMQIKSRYPSPWSIGGGGVNLLTANQSNAETDTTGWAAGNGTLTRNTTTPIAGSGDFKVVSTNGSMFLGTTTFTSVTASAWYHFQALVKTSGCAAGRQVKIYIIWKNGAGAQITDLQGTSIECPTVATVINLIAQAPAGAVTVQLNVYIPSMASGEILRTDSLMIEAIPHVLTVWTSAHNLCYIDTFSNLLYWADNTTTISVTFPMAAYLAGTMVNIIVTDDTGHAVTVVTHAMNGPWYDGGGTLAAITWPQLTLGSLEGSIANIIEYPYVLTPTEYGLLVDTSGSFSSLSLLFNTLYIGNRYTGEIVKGSDKRLLNDWQHDISALLGGTDIPIGSAAVTITQTQGLAARWYVEVKRTDV